MTKNDLLGYSVFATTALTAVGCAGSNDPAAGARCEPLPDAVEARFTAMRGPLGCEASRTPFADPPGGCSGAEALLAAARREYSALWNAADCGDEPPSLAPYVASYEADFRAQNTFTLHRIVRDEYTISAREFGAEHGDGPTIVLMHGFPDNQHLYDRVAPELAQHYRTITFDFVGWGSSSTPLSEDAYSFDAQRRDLEAVLAYFNVRDVVPVVHDASGWPGIDWALDNQESVAALVLLNTAYHPIAGQAPPNVIRAAAALDLRPAFLAAAGRDELMARSLLVAQVSRFFADETQAPIYLPLFARYAATTSVGIFALTATLGPTVMARASNVPRMQAFPRPVTIAFGAEDPYLNVATAEGFAQAFPNAELSLIEGGGHYVQLDRPQRVAAAILETIRRSSGDEAAQP